MEVPAENPDISLAFGFLQNTAENVFLTGKAGTGKTTFLHNLKKMSPKRMVVLAPTGVAAINAGGVTIHSFFQMPFGPWIPGGRAEPVAGGDFKKGVSAKFHRFSREKLNIIRSVDLIVIDEISMVRADLLDGIDALLRRFRDRYRPFGGVQILMIGDIRQLAPVVKDEEWELLKQHYDTPFFFGSNALRESTYVTIELKKVYRQSDPEFIDLLNRVRRGDRAPATLGLINERYFPGMNPETEECIILTTHNYQAKKINEERMNRLPGAYSTFTAQIEGEFPEYSYPTDAALEIKRGAQVMFVKNDSSPEKRYFNGKIGTVTSIDDEMIHVRCANDEATIAVEPESWQNARYGLNQNGEIVETVIGTFTQYPLKAAWAITIHKSQGLTFDRVIIDAASAFAHGQVYVALSRCRTLEGLFLTSKLSPRVLIKDSSITEFTEKSVANPPDEQRLQQAAVAYQHALVLELFDFSPLKRRSGYLLKLLEENRENIFLETVDLFREIHGTITSRVVDVALKFNAQIDTLLRDEPDIGLNAALQERIKKAEHYFIDALKTCADEFARIGKSLDVDNKETRRSLTDAAKRFLEEIDIKSACLASCREGFSVKAYLSAKSKGAIEKPAEKRRSIGFKPDHRGDAPAIPEADRALYEKLKTWRREKAGSRNVAEYMILHQKTMIRIVTQVPSSLKALKALKGMGKRKVASFGEEILGILAEYFAENDKPFSRDDQSPDDMNALPKKKKPNTRKITLNLFKSGKSTSEIASSRNLSPSTIEGHLAYYIRKRKLSVHQFLAPGSVSRIEEFFASRKERELGPAKRHFGEEFSYGELKMVQAHLVAEEG